MQLMAGLCMAVANTTLRSYLRESCMLWPLQAMGADVYQAFQARYFASQVSPQSDPHTLKPAMLS
jgi:hypothetical protein